jgi:hypothetical protein
MATIYSTDRQGPPGPLAASVADLTALANLCTDTFVPGTLAYVAAPTAAYYAWAPNDARTPDGSTIIAGKGGNWILHAKEAGAVALAGENGSVPMPSGVTITQAQLDSEPIFPLSLQPSAPGAAAFGLRMDSTPFNSTYDNVLHLGYNVAFTEPEPRALWSIETDYESTPGNQTVEMHAQVYETGYSGGLIRPFSISYQRGSSTAPAAPRGQLGLTFEYSDAGAGPGVGYLSINEHSTGAQQVKFMTGQMLFAPPRFQVNANDGMIVKSWLPGPNCVIELAAGANGDESLLVDGYNHRFAFEQQGAVVFQIGYAGTVTSSLPLGGTTTPLQMASTAVPLGGGGTTTLTAAQYTRPALRLTDPGLTANATVVLPTTQGPTEWTIDLTAVAFGAATVTLQVGTTAKPLVVSGPAVLRVYSDGVGSVYGLAYF